ncbi:hypothetical protein SLEP1_g24309 [Rubroshorea leprosula]|uniref:Uncharacterized protein n=1 Tax=Rubroshorea leprosula TaxID=152421 RepID=A0AAV5JFI3_9ROSI|nr:hypothetical protein SLEP1_g24309 [Rubroshorea leprosula]
MGDFWAFFRSRELPLHLLPASLPLQLRFLQLENYGNGEIPVAIK